MLNHAVIGIAIGSLMPNPVLAFVTGFASHFLADLIPHGDAHHFPDFKKNRHRTWSVGIVIFDVLGTLSLLLYVFLQRKLLAPLTVASAVVGSLLPDLLTDLHVGLPNIITRHFARFHFWNHDLIARRFRDLATIPGLVIQIALFLIFVQAI